MKYDLVVAYRICPVPAKNPALFAGDKYRLSKLCLESFARSLSGLRVKIYALLDNCPPEYSELFRSNFPAEDLEIINLDKCGNKGTFRKQIELLSKQEDSEVVYFAEDDYLYVKNIANMVSFIRSGQTDFATPYEHPACYGGEHAIKNETEDFSGQKYVTVQHACLTFMATRKTLRKNKRYLLIFSNWFGSDFVVWGCITLGFRFFQQLRFFFWRKNFNIENLKVYGSMIIFAGHRFLFNIKDRLMMPVGSFATHMEKNCLAPGIDWNQYFPKE